MESFNHDTVNLEGYDTGDKINFKLFDNNKSQYIPLGTNLDSEFFSNQLLVGDQLLLTNKCLVQQTFLFQVFILIPSIQ